MKKRVFFERWMKRQNAHRKNHRKKRSPFQQRFNQVVALSAAAYIGMGQAYGEDPAVPATPPAVTAPADVPPAPAQVTAPPPPTNAALPEVVVTGQGYYTPQGVSSPKYTAPLLDTPQTATVIPQELMEDRGVTTLQGALRSVPGISLNAGEAGAQGDNLTIRGFSARGDIYRDGMRDFGSYYRDSFNDQQVEVLKGPASVNFGKGSTGGVVNQVSKTPHREAYNEGTLVAGTDHTIRGTLDVNQPLTGLGEHAAYRINLMAHDSETAGRDISEWRRFGIAPSLAFGLGTASRLNIDYFHQSEDDIPDYGLPFLLGRPAPVDWSNSYGFLDHNFINTQVDMTTAKAEHDFNDKMTLRDQFRYAHYDRDVQITEPRIPAGVTAATPLANIQVTRGQIQSDSIETYLGNMTDFTAKFKTGPIEHAAVTGIEIGQETSDPERMTPAGVPSTSLLNPDTNQPYTATASPVTSRVHTIAKTLAWYIVDTLKLGSHWELTGGARWDQFDAHYQQTIAPATSFERVDTMWSGRGALVFKPVPAGSLYVSYGNSFNPSAEQLALAANTAQIEPEETSAYEFGTKWELFDKALSLTGALFRSDKENARTVDPFNPLLNVLSGDQRVQGVEVGAAGSLSEKWKVFAGYAFMESQVRESNNPLEQGSPVANTPKHSGSVWTTYDLPRQFQVGAGANGVSSRASTATRDAATGLLKEVPGYMTFDAMLSKQITGKLKLQLNLYNLLDKEYFDTLHPSHIIPGAGRTLLITTSFDF